MHKLPSLTNLKTDSSEEKPHKIYSNKQSLMDIKLFLQEKGNQTPRQSSNSIQHNISDQLSKANQSSKAIQQNKEFHAFSNERDALGRLLPKSHPGSSINSELELNFQGSQTSRQQHKNILGSHKQLKQFQHSNDILQQIKLAVEQDIIKRKKKKVNLVGQKLGDSIIKDVNESKNTNQNNPSYLFDKDSHFNIQVKKRVTPVSRSNISLQSINELKIQSPQVDQHIITSKGYLSSRGANDRSIMITSPKHEQSHHNLSQSPQKRILINTKRKASQPGIGHYNIWNKEQFTLKKTPNIILQDKNDMAEQMRLKQKQEIERIEKKKIYLYYQQQKQKEREKFIDSFTPQQEVKIIFPKIKENNKYQIEELKQLQNREKLQMKELNEEANFPVQFTEKLNDLKIKAKKIREAIILWNDQNPYKINKQQQVAPAQQIFRNSEIIDTQGSLEM